MLSSYAAAAAAVPLEPPSTFAFTLFFFFFGWVYGFQPVDQGPIPVVFRSTQCRGTPSQLHNALAAV
jgi:hypothetical protein